jgi:hypothetical protein
MNRNLKQSIWVLALGIAFTGLSAPILAAAVPAQQDQDHDRNQNRDRNDNQYVDSGYYEQGLQDGQHDRQYGDNHSDRQPPNDANDLRAYQDGYKQGLRDATSSPKAQVTTSAPKKQGRAIRAIRFRRTRRT